MSRVTINSSETLLRRPRNRRVALPLQEMQQLALSILHLVKPRFRELGVMQAQQRFKVTDDVRLEPPFASFVSVSQRVLDGIFRDFELLGRQIPITGPLQVPAEVHRTHELIDQMGIAVAVAACSQRQMTR